ncbi:MAG: ABC transporter ATP-binding protein [Alphaproteobacteria bacterium]
MATGKQSTEIPSERDGLHIVDLNVGYGRKSVAEQMTMAIPSGQILGLLGINGAGKSTTLKTIVGLLPPIGGQIMLDGRVIDRADAATNARNGLVLVPEGARSFHTMSVKENLEMGGFVIGKRASLTARIDEILDFFPRLRERLNQRAGLLSGGERQMLAIGRGLMLRPRVLLLDEPFLGLAPILIQEVATRLRELARSTNCGIVIAEQHIGATVNACDRIVVLKDRRLFEPPTSGTGMPDEEEIAKIIFETQ